MKKLNNITFIDIDKYIINDFDLIQKILHQQNIPYSVSSVLCETEFIRFEIRFRISTYLNPVILYKVHDVNSPYNEFVVDYYVIAKDIKFLNKIFNRYKGLISFI